MYRILILQYQLSSPTTSDLVLIHIHYHTSPPHPPPPIPKLTYILHSTAPSPISSSSRHYYPLRTHTDKHLNSLVQLIIPNTNPPIPSPPLHLPSPSPHVLSKLISIGSVNPFTHMQWADADTDDIWQLNFII